MDETMIFKCDDLENYMITETLMKVNKYLEEKGYNGINQIVGYLSTGDSSNLGYIPTGVQLIIISPFISFKSL